MKGEVNILRVPRPMGVTGLMFEYRKAGSEETLDRVRSFYIQAWLANGGYVSGESYSVMELSNFLGCPADRIQLQMKENMLSSRIWDSSKQDELAEQIMGLQLSFLLEDRIDINGQLDLLRRSQGGTYTPFVSGEVNKALDLKQKSTNNLGNMLKTLTGGGSINIFNQNQQQNIPINGVTVEDAIKYISESNKQVIGRPEEVKILEESYDVDSFPQVVASKQVGIDTSKEGLQQNRAQLLAVTDDYKGAMESSERDHHDMRREFEQAIDVDEEDPEVAEY